MTLKPMILQSAMPLSRDELVTALQAVGDPVPGTARLTESTYCDSFDWRLFKAGLWLAQRKERAGGGLDLYRKKALLPKAHFAGSLGGGLAEDLPDGEPRRLVAPLIGVRRLLPRLVVDTEVLPLELRDEAGKVVLRARIEQLACRRPDETAGPALGTRVVLEPVRGYRKQLRRARKLVGALIGDALETAPVAEAAARALGIEPGDYASKMALPLDETMCAGAAARRIHLSLLETMELNEDGTARNLDSEFLHDFRVAVRRSRSALSLVDKGVLPPEVIARGKEDFRWIGTCTNRMRDLDVYMIAIPDYKAAVPEEYRPALDPLHDHLAGAQRREARRIAAMIRGPRYREIRDRWRSYVTATAASPEDGSQAMRPVRDLAGDRIAKVHRRLMKEGRAITDDSPNAALHELRITGKKLRYLLEFFQSLYPKGALGRLITAMKRLQDVLGTLHDAEIQSHAIRDFAAEMAGAGAPFETQMALGMVAESILRQKASARSAFRDRFAEFSRPEVQDSFQRLFRP